MKKNLLLAACLCCLCLTATQRVRAQYVPTPENLEARKQFEGFRFGIFLHWGIYSEFAQGEWYLNTGQLNKDEYAKAASCFYPVRFNAQEWVKAIRESGARYITFTSRHHDGFSMFHTAQNRYNIVDATPFGRDVLQELADACHEQGVRLHLYYSILDWIRDDYPIGRTGRFTDRTLKPNYDTYFAFMKNQGIAVGTDEAVFFRDTGLHSGIGVELEHLVFTMHRHEVFWLDQLKHQLLFFLGSMSCGMQGR